MTTHYLKLPCLRYGGMTTHYLKLQCLRYGGMTTHYLKLQCLRYGGMKTHYLKLQCLRYGGMTTHYLKLQCLRYGGMTTHYLKLQCLRYGGMITHYLKLQCLRYGGMTTHYLKLQCLRYGGMTTHYLKLQCLLCLLSLLAMGDQDGFQDTSRHRPETSGSRKLMLRLSDACRCQSAKDVVPLVGDGLGLATLTAARIFKGQRQGQPGESSHLAWEKFSAVALTKSSTSCLSLVVPDFFVLPQLS
ncbi:hypothetical protein J6590_080870 [Homalodisca vitripennis]|nr:hypothetical protein J6590_080870 [Homalodisca vitripennis]